MMAPTSRTDLRCGSRIELLFGINLIASDGKVQDNRLVIEVGLAL